MSFEQICDRMADHFQVDARMLARTDLLDPVDPRLVRLTNGNFSLREWLDEATEPDEPVESPDSPDEEPQETSQEPSISPEAVSKGQSHPRPKRSAVLLKIQQAFRRLIMALRWRAARRHT